MLIQHAVLGLLSLRPLTGYDIKKIMQESTFLHWSGNNNQIYKALMQLRDEGCVVGEVLHEDDAPTKKLYTITESGRDELRRLSLSMPEAPEVKKPFLVQLAFCGNLSRADLETLLNRYEGEVRGAMFLNEKQQKDGFFSHGSTAEESELWKLIHENIADSYRRELDWVGRVRQAVLPLAGEEKRKEHVKMNYQVIVRNGQKYVKLIPKEGLVASESDGRTLVQFCAEGDTNLLMLPFACLAPEFLRLSTGVAGLVLQKLTNYSIRAAAVLDTAAIKGKFKDFMLEANRGQSFRVFDSEEQAEQWLIGGNINEKHL